MKPGDRRKAGRGGLELVEEAVHLLRLNASAALPAYFAGTLPFILGLLYFWSAMSRSPYAGEQLAGASLGMALLFLWMKFWQAIFCDTLRARISASPPTRWNVRRVLRVLVIQSAIQPSAVIALPLAVLALGLPFPWVYAFYQNVTALSDGETAEIGKPLRRAWQQMRLWPGQNHVILLLLAAFALAVLLNVFSVCWTLPGLLKTFLGIESVYTQSPTSLLNTTSLMAMFAVTFLCVDPIVKTVYLLRCFYGESLKTGEDLRAELRRFTVPKGVASSALIVLLLLGGVARLSAGEEPVPAPPSTAPAGIVPTPGIPAPALDQAINDVIHRAKYTWRMPRENNTADNAGDNVVMRFIKRVCKTVGGWIKDAFNWIIEHLGRLFRHLPVSHGSSGSGSGWVTALEWLLFVLLAAVISAFALLLMRAWQRRHRQPAMTASEPLAPVIDVADENVGADQLPEDGWTKLGRELLARGEFRLALRAFYFASLANLAGRNLLSIAKFKSNRDYERELGRRGHSLPDLRSWFGENVSVFDRCWYGLKDVDGGMVERFLANVERIKAA